jgi:hypothetical protein
MDNSDNWHAPNPDELEDLRVRRTSPSVGSRDAFVQLKVRLCQELLADLDPALDVRDKTHLRPYVHERLDALLAEFNLVLNRSEKRRLLDAIVEELSGSTS